MYIVPFFLGLIAEQYGKIGRIERGLTFVSEALAAVERTGERWYEAELYRSRGALLLARNDHVEAEVALQRALAIARDAGRIVTPRAFRTWMPSSAMKSP